MQGCVIVHSIAVWLGCGCILSDHSGYRLRGIRSAVRGSTIPLTVAEDRKNEWSNPAWVSAGSEFAAVSFAACVSSAASSYADVPKHWSSRRA